MVYIKINCDTPISSIISVSSINAQLAKLSIDIKPITEYSRVLKEQIRAGEGLSKIALTVEGHSTTNKEASSQISKLAEFKSSYKSVKKSILDSAKNQRKKELRLLKNAILDKITEIKIVMNKTNNKIIELEAKYKSNQMFNRYNTMEAIELVSVKKIYRDFSDALKEYNEKLKIVETELGKV